jgi:hypothetical protein
MNAETLERRPATEEICGVIEGVIHNDEDGFCFLRIKTKGHRVETTVVGSLPSVTAGEWLVAEGWWVRDSLCNSSADPSTGNYFQQQYPMHGHGIFHGDSYARHAAVHDSGCDAIDVELNQHSAVENQHGRRRRRNENVTCDHSDLD